MHVYKVCNILMACVCLHVHINVFALPPAGVNPYENIKVQELKGSLQSLDWTGGLD